VHSASKVGRDAAELCGLTEPTGVLATSDLDALLALKPDALSYFGPGPGREPAVVADVVPFLSAGVNVVTTSLSGLTYPPAAVAELREPLDKAAAAGAVSFFATGIEPGFASDLLPLSLLAASDDIESVRVQEIADYSEYPVVDVLREWFGFGQPTDYSAALFDTQALLAAWGGVVQVIADAIGLTLDSIEGVHEVATVDTDLSTAVGTLAAGTISGVRFEVRGLVAGKPFVTLEHVNRMGPDVAPHWPQADPLHLPAYRVEIKGRPSMRCELLFERVDGTDHGVIATAMRAVNAIPAVVAAAPGLLSALDLPVVAGRHLVIG
jgi:4-hydroxy-tetrahydrodipicolinate reductase